MINEHNTNNNLLFTINKNSALDCRLVSSIFINSLKISLQSLLVKNLLKEDSGNDKIGLSRW